MTMLERVRQWMRRKSFISQLKTGRPGIARNIALVAGLGVLSGCSITQVVEPVKATHLSALCILDNKDILMDEFQPEMQRQIAAKGIPTRVYLGTRPAQCSHYLEYTANWKWDMAMYLVYADLRVYDHSGIVGTANYNARNGGGRMDKFGRTAEKLRPLVDQLFGSVQASSTAAPVPAEQTNAGTNADRLKELQDLKDRKLITDEEYDRKKEEILKTI